MSAMLKTLLHATAFASAAMGHGHIKRVLANGKEYPGFEPWGPLSDDMVSWQFTTDDEGPVPVSSLNSPDIICHQQATNARASVPVKAGETIQLVSYNEQGGFEHPGPIMHYIAPCGQQGCAKVDKTALDFSKFYHAGLIQGGEADDPTWESQKWATTEIHKNKQQEGAGWTDTYPVTIPNVPAGEYVLQFMRMGLHMAFEGQAEFYPQCVNIKVSGGDVQAASYPTGGMCPTDMYSSQDQGVSVDIWKNLDQYEIPGPPVAFQGGSSGSGDGGNVKSYNTSGYRLR